MAFNASITPTVNGVFGKVADSSNLIMQQAKNYKSGLQGAWDSGIDALNYADASKKVDTEEKIKQIQDQIAELKEANIALKKQYDTLLGIEDLGDLDIDVEYSPAPAKDIIDYETEGKKYVGDWMENIDFLNNLDKEKFLNNFNPKTKDKNAVKTAQKYLGVDADGKFGKNSKKALEEYLNG